MLITRCKFIQQTRWPNIKTLWSNLSMHACWKVYVGWIQLGCGWGGGGGRLGWRDGCWEAEGLGVHLVEPKTNVEH